MLALGIGLFLSGCGGGGSNSAPENTTRIDAGLSNGDFYDVSQDRFYDDYLCRATASTRVFVEMRSDDLDPELFIFRRNAFGGFDLIASDDDSGSGADALVEFEVQAGVDYLVRATSFEDGESGFYRIIFSRSLGTPLVIVPSPGAATRNLPALAPLKPSKLTTPPATP
jgi:hypothetical protein